MPRLGGDGRQSGGGETKSGGSKSSGGGNRGGSVTSGDTDRERAAGVRAGTATDRAGSQGDSRSKGGSFHGRPAPGFDRFGDGSAAGMIDRGVLDAGGVSRLATAGLNQRQAQALRSQNRDTLDDGLGGLTGVIGLSERVDVDAILGNPNDPQQDASWHGNPGAIIGGAAGLLAGLPGAGLIGGKLADWAGASVNLGPDVLAGGGPAGPGPGAGGRGIGRPKDSRPQGPITRQVPPRPDQPGQPAPRPNNGLLVGEDLAYLTGQTPRPTPAERFQPGMVRGRLVYDPTQGQVVPVG